MADAHGAQDWGPTAAAVGAPMIAAIIAWLAARRRSNSEAGKFDAEARRMETEAAVALQKALDDRVETLLEGYEAQRRMDRETIDAMAAEIKGLKQTVAALTNELHEAKRQMTST